MMLLCFITPLKQVRMLSREVCVPSLCLGHSGQTLDLLLTRANSLNSCQWPKGYITRVF